MVKITFDDLQIQKLDNNHELKCFDCGISDLNEFLMENAHHQMSNKLNVTYICTYNLDIVAYFTWCSDSIIFKKLDSSDKKELIDREINYENVPALKLCRLAVSYKYHGNRIDQN